MKTRNYILNFMAVFAALALGTMVWARAAAPASPAGHDRGVIVIQAQPGR